MYVNTELCSECGGQCCKRHPGAAMPADIIEMYGDDLRTALRNALLTGKWVLDCWEGDPRTRIVDMKWDDWDKYTLGHVDFPRPRASEDRKGSLFSREWEPGQCVFLTDEGCELSEDTRPYTCRMLEPSVDKCISHDPNEHGKLTCSLAWIEHADLICEVVDEVENSKVGKGDK